MKKSSKSTCSMFSNCGLFFAGVLTLVFLSQGYSKTSILGLTEEYTSGYTWIDFSIDEGRSVMTAISLLAVTILACIIVVLSIINFLSDIKAIKLDKKATKVISGLNLCLAVVTFAFSVIALGCIASLASEIAIASVGWALIVNLIVSALMLVLAIPAVMHAKKGK